MIHESRSIDDAIAYLNELLALDPRGFERVISTRIPINAAIADHPTCQVHAPPGEKPSVGILGVLNGLFGALGPEAGKWEGYGPIVAIYDEGPMVKLLRFERGEWMPKVAPPTEAPKA